MIAYKHDVVVIIKVGAYIPLKVGQECKQIRYITKLVWIGTHEYTDTRHAECSIIWILRVIQFNVRYSILVIYYESNSM